MLFKFSLIVFAASLPLYCVGGTQQKEVACILSDKASSCEIESINVILPPSRIENIVNVIPPLVQPATEYKTSIRDWTTIFLAFLGLLGFIFNGIVFFTQRRNRNEDKKNDKFQFWLKEIIYPSYLSPIIEMLVELDCDYRNWVNKPESELLEQQKDDFLTKWSDIKVKILNTLPNDSTFPYLNMLFKGLREKTLKFDEDFLTSLQGEGLVFSILSEVTEPNDSVGSIQLNPEYFSDLIQLIYHEINNEQTKVA